MKNIFIITPSWLIRKKKEFTDSIKRIEQLGFCVLNPVFVAELPTPREKAEQIHRAFSDKQVDLVLALRGGYSSMKVLPYIDFELIRRNPKPLAGFSDLTTLLNTIAERTGIVTLHAPMLWNFTSPTDFTVRSFLNALNGFPEKNLLRGARTKVYHPGTARGTLKGGNLITLTALISTAWETATDGSILFLEDVDEKLHEVDRYLTQWILSGKLQKSGALILGNFRGIKPDDVFRIISSQMEVTFPVVYSPYIGHVKNKLTLPVGAVVELNTEAKSLTITSLNFPENKR